MYKLVELKIEGKFYKSFVQISNHFSLHNFPMIKNCPKDFPKKIVSYLLTQTV